MANFNKIRELLKRDAQTGPTAAAKQETQGNIPAEPENAVTGTADPKETVFNETEGNGAEKESFLLQVGRRMERNIQKGNLSAWAIYKAMKRNAPPEEIALIAVQGLSFIMGDSMLIQTVAKTYREKYGIRIEPEPPYNITREK